MGTRVSTRNARHQIATCESKAYCQCLPILLSAGIGLDPPKRNQNTETNQGGSIAFTDVRDFHIFVAWAGVPSALSFGGFEPVFVHIKHTQKTFSSERGSERRKQNEVVDESMMFLSACTYSI
jgi:hypothetical protein